MDISGKKKRRKEIANLISKLSKEDEQLEQDIEHYEKINSGGKTYQFKTINIIETYYHSGASYSPPRKLSEMAGAQIDGILNIHVENFKRRGQKIENYQLYVDDKDNLYCTFLISK